MSSSSAPSCVGLRFNRNNFCNAGTSADFNTLPLTIEFWARCTGQQGHWIGGAANGGLGGESDPTSWRIESHRPYIVINSTPYAQVGADINDGEWHHVAFTIDASGNITSFLDGEPQPASSSSSSGAPPGAALDGAISLAIGMGGVADAGNNGVGADMRYVRISNGLTV
jgi:hypothetical protein